jgi:acyl-CoA hydrolase
MSELRPKHPKESAVDGYVYKIFPNDLNSQGTAFGGTIMSQLDRLALVVAERHCNKVCVTVSVDAVHFLAPAREGDNLMIYATINRAWTSSMEIGLRVVAEHPFSEERRHILSAYFTFVALNDWGKPSAVPKVLAETPAEKRRYEEAEHRRARRILAAKEQEEFRKSFSKET